MRDKLKEAGAEPDESWCLEVDKEFPDFVLEVALTSGGLPKLEIYRRMRISEVWFWRNKRLEIFRLNQEGNYAQIPASRLLPDLDVALIERCVGIHDWLDATEAFEAGLTPKAR
jgi:Uma2 family endonuclease